MSSHEPAPEERYAEIVRQILARDPEVASDSDSTQRRFGMSGELKTAGKMFAFLAKGRIIVKLPKLRVASLIAAGLGEPCEMGKGRVMKEWVAIRPEHQAEWPELIAEAKTFVRAQTQERIR